MLIPTRIRQHVIAAPPPTPNGDLHVGHIAGPYFGADVLRRYLGLRKCSVVSALSVDCNQSYVVTTAERLNIDPVSLTQQSYESIIKTLDMAEIKFDVLGIPDAAYGSYVTEWFTQLYAAGVLKRRTRSIPYDPQSQRFLFESYASGYCPVCLAGTNGNICEACGHPNDTKDLLGLHSSAGTTADMLEERKVTEFVLSLEEFRNELWRYLERNIPEKRPMLQRLLNELFSKPLPDFPVTFQSDWGLSAPFPGADGLVINVWAEMVPGHYHWLSQAEGAGHDLFNSQNNTRYIQFLGFDNSFFYCVAQLALAFAAQRAGLDHLLPTAFVTNEFYLMENFKFSTSQGHLIWARDMLSNADQDELRFYLAWSNPEYNQANFAISDFEEVVVKKLRKPFTKLSQELSHPPATNITSRTACAMLNRFASAYAPESFSMRIAAQTIANGLDLALIVDDSNKNEIATALAIGMAPIMPNMADRLWASCGHNGPLLWPENVGSLMSNVSETFNQHPSLTFQKVDVFCTGPQTGNPAMVVFGGEKLAQSQMQAIAREVNLSETVFILPPTNEADFRVRIFTAQREIPFAGHPSLAAAHSFAISKQLDALELIQQDGLGKTRIHRGNQDADWCVDLPTPRNDTPTPRDMAVIASMLGLKPHDFTPRAPSVLATGVRWILVEVNNTDVLAQISPKFSAIADWSVDSKAVGLVTFALSDTPGIDANMRSFAPAEGINEDPVCGSCAGSLAALLSQGSKREFTFIQGDESNRSGRLHVWTTPGHAPILSGSTLTSLEGTFYPI